MVGMVESSNYIYTLVLLQDLSAKTMAVPPMQGCSRCQIRKVQNRREAGREVAFPKGGKTDHLHVTYVSILCTKVLVSILKMTNRYMTILVCLLGGA